MKRLQRQVCLLALFASLAAAAPRLVVMIPIDQFRYDYVSRFRAEYTGGLRQLLNGGAVFTNAHFEHSPTVTAVGHSILLTGAMPSVSGIVGNEWYDRDLGAQVSSVSDDTVGLLGAPGKRGASPRRLQVSTLGDEIKMAGLVPSRAYGISVKDRSAILPVGHTADGAFWFDPASGNFVSSTYYFQQLPAWVEEFNRSRAVDAYLGKEWTSLSGGKPFRKIPATRDKAGYDALERSPFGNEILILLAERAIEAEKLGQGSGTDLLSISFSANDRVGHGVGPDSEEVHDLCLQTDRLLGRFFQFLDSRVGLDKVLLVVTADHGVAPMPERNLERKMPGGRMTEEKVLAAVEAALNKRYGVEKWIIGKSGPAPYFDHGLIRSKGLDLGEVQETAAAAARAVPHIARVYTARQLERGEFVQDLVSRRVANGYHRRRHSDLFIVPEPYWLFEKSGTSHGTPYNYDTHVPVIFAGPGIKPGFYHQRIQVNDIAPTLATLLGVNEPSGSSGRALGEILATH